ncbi:hypothetical protein GC722_15910 [Auraticoccus sp. F435]|uniref:Uncharacterized protein n=1 Tax=Auraticoccus cholistanensis TaxID=2656650 RepID=A0A6A9V1M1_9ACTN|nr:hypothetical protein [Auraticoccus cholistanensis]MVA77491.1 hypothetical protein [Auraticoccus cholistanensis]
MSGLRLPWRRPALPAELAAELAELLPGRPRVLAWAEGDTGVVAALPATLAVRRVDGWWLVGWHEVESGGWSAPDSELSWVLVDGRRGRMRLREPGRLPEVFRERVEATIVVRREVTDDATGAQFTLSARRRLDDPGAGLAWHTTLVRGTTWRTPGVREAVERAMRALRAEYDFPA